MTAVEMTAPAPERIFVFEKMGKGEFTPDEFAAWLRSFAKPIKGH